MVPPSPLRSLPPRFSLRSYGVAAGEHAHGHAQAVLPLQGRLALRLGPLRGEVQAGTGVLIPAGQPHDFGAGGPNRFLVLDFESALPRGGFFAIDAEFGHLLAYVQALAARADRPAELDHHAGALLSDAVQGRARALQLPPELALRPEVPAPSAPLRQVLARMVRDLDQPLRVAALAAEVGWSAGRLHTEFRRQLGESPARHLAGLRLDRAGTLLREGRLSIAQVAHACGFSEQSALTRAMRRQLGETPGALRRTRP